MVSAAERRLSKTRQVVRQSLDRALGRTPDPAMLEELEAALLSADLGVRVVDRLMTHVRDHARGADAANPEALQNVLSRTCTVFWRRCKGRRWNS